MLARLILVAAAGASLAACAYDPYPRHANAYCGPQRDRDNNPPGRAGGPGTNWENPPGHRGGPGASPDKPGRCR